MSAVLHTNFAQASGCTLGGITNTTSVSTTQTGPCTIIANTTTFDVTSNGVIQGGSDGINNSAIVTTLTNNGTISGTNYGINNVGAGTITTLININTISGGLYGITNAGGITTLNNKQGATSTALTYTGVLPQNYNVIVSSTLDYGKLAATSVTNAPLTSGITFGVYGTSTLTNNTYSAVLSGLSSININSSSLSGTYGSFSWQLINSSGSIWDLVVSTTPTPAPTPAPATPSTPVPNPSAGLTAGSSFTLSNIGVTANPVFNGGTLVLTSGNSSSTNFIINTAGGTITSPTSGSATMSGVFSGTGPLTINGTGTLILSGANTYTGGTTLISGTLQGNTTSLQGSIINNSQVVFNQSSTGIYSGSMSGSGSLLVQSMGSGTLILNGNNTFTGGTTVLSGILSVSGASPTGTGQVYVGSGAMLMGVGTIQGNINVAGTFKPGNSPGYLLAQSTVTMNTGSTYQQDIAGTSQASNTSPVGANGYYSFLNVTGGQFVIQPGAALSPRLGNLFAANEAGYGSAIYTPVLGDKFTILSASNGISGRFTSVNQPAELASGTQFLPFYNFGGSNSVELAVIPTSYANTLASYTTNTRGIANVFDQLVAVNFAGLATTNQEQLMYSGASQSAASLPGFIQSLAGEIYGASLAVVSQTTQRVQQALLTRLGDSLALPSNTATLNQTGINSALINNSLPGGAPGAHISSNPAGTTDTSLFNASMAKGAAWGEVSYQRGNRSGDDNASGFSSNLYQVVVGADAYAEHGIKLGGGVALSNTNVAISGGSSAVQQGSVFFYGKLPVDAFVFDGMASYGFNTTDQSRVDPTAYTSGLQAKGVRGNDALLSAGVSRAFNWQELTLTPFARVTWQQVTQSGFSEGTSPAALTIDRYSGSGVRGVLGLGLGSTITDPMRANYTYRVNLGVGADSPNLLNPNLNASMAGFGTIITTANVGSTFVQAGIYATAKFSDNAFAYAGLSGEVRSGQNLSNLSVGIRIQF